MIAFSVGSLNIYWYGIMYFIGFLIAYVMLLYGQRHGRYKNTVADTIIAQDLDGMMIAILCGVMIGGRLGEVLIYNFGYYVAHPLKVFAYQDGGMSFIGGILGVSAALLLYFYFFSPLSLKERTFLELGNLVDTLIPLVPVGIFFGRFGNYLNQELYGVVAPHVLLGSGWRIELLHSLHFITVYPAVDQLLRINTNFLSMLGEGVIIAFIMRFFFFKKTLSRVWIQRQLSCMFLLMYSFVRFLLEYLRQDSQAEFVHGFTKSQWFFVIFFVLALGGFGYQAYRNRAR